MAQNINGEMRIILQPNTSDSLPPNREMIEQQLVKVGPSSRMVEMTMAMLRPSKRSAVGKRELEGMPYLEQPVRKISMFSI